MRKRDDRAGVIVFGREAAIEVPPFDDDVPDTGSFEAFLERRDATNLEGALKLAAASFPEDTAKRIVIVTDGNENLGSAECGGPDLGGQRDRHRRGAGAARHARGSGGREGDAAGRHPPGQPVRSAHGADEFPGRRSQRQDADGARARCGSRAVPAGARNWSARTPVELPPGKTVVGFRHTIDKPAMYTYQAVFVPDDPADDLLPQNNQASAFTHVRGRGRVLLIEDSDHAGRIRTIWSNGCGS